MFKRLVATLFILLINNFASAEYFDYSKYYNQLTIKSPKAIIYDADSGDIIFQKKANEKSSIASLTKLMTAMVLIDSNLDLNEKVKITKKDQDRIKGTKSRLWLGSELTRKELLSIALIASDNRAASALSNSYPGGKKAFVQAMNVKAKQLGMDDTSFADPTGLDKNNISTAIDLVKMTQAAQQYPIIRELSTSSYYEAYIKNKKIRLNYNNTNLLVRQGLWDIDISKTGYIREAGKCLIMQTKVMDKPIIMVFLKSYGKYTRTADAKRVKKWLESVHMQANLASK
ncbi:peptidase S11 [Methylophilales bacterium MBRSG12]|uniref:Peptidase S11 n=1 Tax=Methylophilales bacterium MBRS-H7 TaxID=1623450 RepID=A0A0H4J1M1_9PROT|nr:peptidase S11 [Methylophilales bacterium MBRSF5]AKO65663.1 peptidase S11 [Methylophilales bacterium MBRS-H7]AKO66985.1 peptidase S11 [Methylophilales bacterium MBRSG12]